MITLAFGATSAPSAPNLKYVKINTHSVINSYKTFFLTFWQPKGMIHALNNTNVFVQTNNLVQNFLILICNSEFRIKVDILWSSQKMTKELV